MIYIQTINKCIPVKMLNNGPYLIPERMPEWVHHPGFLRLPHLHLILYLTPLSHHKIVSQKKKKALLIGPFIYMYKFVPYEYLALTPLSRTNPTHIFLCPGQSFFSNIQNCALVCVYANCLMCGG